MVQLQILLNQINVDQFIDKLFSLENPLFWALFLLLFFLITLYLTYRSAFRPMRKKFLDEKRELEFKNIKLMALFSEINPNPLLRLNKEGIIVYSNSYADKAFGKDFKSEKVHLSNILSDIELDFTELIANDLREEFTTVYDGKAYAVTFVGISYLQIINAYFYDITKLKKAEAKLIEYKDRLKGLTRWQENLIESERERIAGNLHDDIGQQISLLKMQLQEKQSAKSGELEQVYDSIDNLHNEIRKICYELKPQLLEELGLFAAINSMVNRIQKDSRILGSTNLIGEEQRLPFNKELAIYRVVQESINNIIKHSGAKEFSVQLIYSGDTLRVIISDDGKGFDVEKTIASGENRGFGLLNMSERIENIGGSIKFNSAENEGTIIFIEVSTERENGKSD